MNINQQFSDESEIATINCPVIIMNPILINLTTINNNLPTIEITPSVDDEINQIELPPEPSPSSSSLSPTIDSNSMIVSSIFRRISTTIVPSTRQKQSMTIKPIGWNNKLGFAAVILILIMFILDVLTLSHLLRQISIYERSQNLLERIKFLIDYSGTLSDIDCERLSHMPHYEEIMSRIRINSTINKSSNNNIDKQSLVQELSFVNEQKSNLLTVIVVTFVAMIIHFIGFIGVLRQSFTLTLFETLFLIILLIMKPSLSSSKIGWIIWIIYAICLPLFFIYQIRLYYVKIRRKK
ncbi:hypothetical protein DERP_001747 [Dermatophagoides pteronyssinus]|uniref:Uncharacterized protein n=3 Tax=Dermatophagoides pteronyssinus TaxID=6956 RepID=A0ABQ8JBF6_DERPT|nr:uncharacterized protein LOC113790541 [Dermatophagoides pteronyssinus]KAH9419914.1 hypothetical protein DERP_001747 [Dermatophagoides pteronyssinus]